MELIRLEVKDYMLRYSKQGTGGRDWTNVQLSNLGVKHLRIRFQNIWESDFSQGVRNESVHSEAKGEWRLEHQFCWNPLNCMCVCSLELGRSVLTDKLRN